MSRTRLPGQGQEPFDTTEVELDRQRHGDDGVVDVGGEDLPLGPLGGGGAYEGRTARVPGRFDGDPVTGAHDPHRIARGDERRVGPYDTVGGDDVALPAVDPYDPPGPQPIGVVRGERGGPGGVPALGSQRGEDRGGSQRVTLHKGGPGSRVHRTRRR